MERFTLTTTEAPKQERRRTAPPTLTVERGPRNAGRSRVTLEPEVPPLDIYEMSDSEGCRSYALKETETKRCVAEVRLVGPGTLSYNEAIVFLCELRDRLNGAGYEP